MKHFTLILCGLLLSIAAHAALSIESGKKYRIVCVNNPTGCVTLGAQHDAAPMVYYLNNAAETPDDAWWTVTRDDQGYTFSNVVTGQYLVYVEGRLTNEAGEYTAKGLQLTDDASQAEAHWTIVENTMGSVIIVNVGNSEQYFNLRTDGTFLMGTYGSANTANGYFLLYDEEGKSIVVDEADNDEGGNVSGESGINSAGEAWERVGLSDPVVVTTDLKDPVYYSIQNIRSGQYVGVSGTSLVQTAEPTTKFYFVQTDGGLNIFADNGAYVSTSFYYNYNGRRALSLSTGDTAGKNTWKTSFEQVLGYEGYALTKTDNMPDNDFLQSDYLSWNDYKLSSGRAVGLYDVDGGSTFVFSSSDARHVSHLAENGITVGQVKPSGFRAYVDTLRLGGKDLTYDRNAKAYYATLPESLRGGADYSDTLHVTFKANDARYSLRIGDNAPEAGTGAITIPAITCEESYTLTVVNEDTNEEVATAPLHFTFLPIVELTMPSCNSSTYTTGTMRVTDADIAGYDSTVIAAFRYRGASAQSYAKKSFAIKLRDAEGNSVDREYFGLRDDNNWILDAMAVDRACMRNRVSTDLWNDFATPPYHRQLGYEKKAKSGTRGRFVEVFLNGAYHGLYCMTEKMDRKQLKLKKYVAETDSTEAEIHGVLYKSSQWGYEVFMGHNTDSNVFPKTAPRSYNNNTRSETWANYEVKYPDWEDEKIDWGPLWNAVNFVATSSDEEFDNGIGTWFDFPVATDYYLFIETMLATDNHGKNMFFFVYDTKAQKYSQKVGFAIWDLDGTWGRRWDGSSSRTYPAQDFDTFLWNNEHGTFTLFHRLKNSNYWGWEQTLASRYAELREGEFTVSKLVKRFTDYRDLFAESGADKREQTKWYSYHSNIANDVDYIATWIEARLSYLDEQYGYTPKPDGAADAPVTDEAHLAVSGGQGCIFVHSTQPRPITIHTVGGQLVRRIMPGQPQTVIDGLDAGLYIVNGRKVVVR